MPKTVFVHGDPHLATLLRHSLNGHEVRVASLGSGRTSLAGLNSRQHGRSGAPVVVIESPRGRESALRVLQSVASEAYVVMAPRHLLRSTLGKIAELVGALHAPPTPPAPPRGPSLEAFVEEKLTALIKKMKGTETRDLYTVLVKELERPLITLVLKETGGNQIQAARLLGVNRNTLRKKIRDLKILAGRAHLVPAGRDPRRHSTSRAHSA